MSKDGVNDGYLTISFNGLSFDESSITIQNDDTQLTITEHIYDFEREMYTIRYDEPFEDTFNITVNGTYSVSQIFNIY